MTLGDAPCRSCQRGQQLSHDEVMFTPLHLLFQNRFTLLLGTMLFSLVIWLCSTINPISWSFLIRGEKLCSLIIKQADTSWIFQKIVINSNTKSVTNFHREIYKQKVYMRKQVAVTTHLKILNFLKKKVHFNYCLFVSSSRVSCIWKESRFLSPRNGDYKMDSASFTQMTPVGQLT